MRTAQVRATDLFGARALLLIVLSCGLGACAIHPLPENVTGIKTTRIVHRIRCEARDAVIQAEQWLLSRRQYDKLRILESIGIVYNFTFNGMEIDGLTASATVTKPLTRGMWSYNPTLGDTLTRQNVRTFTVIDNFKILAQKMDGRKCLGEPVGPNYQYPIVGTIGIKEMIITFINLTLHEDLGAEQGPSVDITANGPPTMVDTISFTTALTASINPMIMLVPATMAAQLTSGFLNGSLSRTDIHQVIVGLGLPGPLSSLGISAPVSATKPPAYVIHPQFGMLVSGSPRSGGEAAALEAVNNQILRFEVPKSLIVTP
jgi:hypothetical protein